MENNFDRPLNWSQDQAISKTARFMSNVYAWMMLGVAMSGFVAYGIYQNTDLAIMIAQNRAAIWGIFILQFALVMGISAAINRIRSFCMMGLFGMIGFSLMAMFFPSLGGGQASMVFGLIGIVVFSGLTAYDTQKIKALYNSSAHTEESDRKLAILGALTLYLDFINLFLSLLRVFGRRR